MVHYLSVLWSYYPRIIYKKLLFLIRNQFDNLSTYKNLKTKLININFIYE